MSGSGRGSSYPSHYKDLLTLKRQYGDFLFQKSHDGFYTCFFKGCGQQMKANFQRHVNRHEEQADDVDDVMVENRRKESLAPAQLMQRLVSEPRIGATALIDIAGAKMCMHEDHEALWPDTPRLQPLDAFYNHSTKCKRCYIFLQTDRVRRQRSGQPPAPRPESSRRRRDGSELGAGVGLSSMSGLSTMQQLQRGTMEDGVGGMLMIPGFGQAAAAPSAPKKPRRTESIAQRRLRKQEEEHALQAALLGQRAVTVSSGPVNDEGCGLGLAAAAAAWGHAVAREARETAGNGVDWGTEGEVLLQELQDGAGPTAVQKALRSILGRAMQQRSGSQAAAVALFQSESRILDVRADLRRRAESLEGNEACGMCNKQTDPSPGQGAPVVCVGRCARPFHASCAQSPDEGYVCEDCRQGVPVVRNEAGDFFTWVEDSRSSNVNVDRRGPFVVTAAAPPKSLGELLWNACVNDVLLDEENAALRNEM